MSYLVKKQRQQKVKSSLWSQLSPSGKRKEEVLSPANLIFPAVATPGRESPRSGDVYLGMQKETRDEQVAAYTSEGESVGKTTPYKKKSQRVCRKSFMMPCGPRRYKTPTSMFSNTPQRVPAKKAVKVGQKGGALAHETRRRSKTRRIQAGRVKETGLKKIPGKNKPSRTLMPVKGKKRGDPKSLKRKTHGLFYLKTSQYHIPER